MLQCLLTAREACHQASHVRATLDTSIMATWTIAQRDHHKIDMNGLLQALDSISDAVFEAEASSQVTVLPPTPCLLCIVMQIPYHNTSIA